MDASFWRHAGWSATVGVEDMLKCSCAENPMQGGDGADVGLLLVAEPALMPHVNPFADPVPQLPECVWSPPCHATSQWITLAGRGKKSEPIRSSSALIFKFSRNCSSLLKISCSFCQAISCLTAVGSSNYQYS